ncbi:Imm9 family immunity protein [Pseudomonas sp. NPDC090755]|uniref:Imm9 family immunity protein n=1 Tax=Pseudomonas sp. NPDC090755 TaxID=3364481 RepID=UPI003839E7C0
MLEPIRCIISNESPNINNTINLTEATNTLNEYISKKLERINIEDLNGWSILISATIRNTDSIGIFKRTKRYPSDKEFEVSISIPVPTPEDAPYGLPSKDSGYYLPLDQNKFHIISPQYSKYKNLYEYITKSIELSINKAFEHGLTCHGHKIRFSK